MAHSQPDDAGTAGHAVVLISPRRSLWRAASALALLVATSCNGAAAVPDSGDLPSESPSAPAPLPERLSETGLYAGGGTARIDPRNLAYTPQYPLWSDGAAKRRWLRLPEGQHIDASDPEHLRFPAGTRFYKEFSLGAHVETRLLELTTSGARYASYVWNADQSDALLAPERGLRAVRTLDGGEAYDVPSRADCAACHSGRGQNSVLGFTPLQLSAERDPLAPHAEQPAPDSLDLPALVQRGVLVGLPEYLLALPPRIAASSATERAALGYLYGNCAHCHSAEGPLRTLELDLEPPQAPSEVWRVRASLLRESRYRPPGVETERAVAGHPEAGTFAFRIRSTESAARMPPLGSRVVDRDAVELIQRWIQQEL
jgi:mono/diheme cytochrome c family protein/cytochrome c553